MTSSSRVNLRVPPRLIESARAAQYANRETFGARNALDRMAKEVDRRVEAEQRAAPGRDPQRGGLLDFEKRRIPRPKLRNRWRPRWSVNTGFMYILRGNGPLTPYGYPRNRLWIAPGNASGWVPVADITSGGFYRVELPLPDGMVVLCAASEGYPDEWQSTVVTGYRVTLDDVSEIVVPEAVARKFFKLLPSGSLGILTDYHDYNYTRSSYFGFGYVQAAGQSPYLLSGVSSGVYDALLLPEGQRIYAEDALRLYGSDIPVLGATRASENQVNQELRYFDSTYLPLLSLATTFGTMGDLSVSSSQLPSGHDIPVAPRTEPVILNDTVERNPASHALPEEPLPNAPLEPVNLGETSLLITYDYHGGSYCRDRLADLGLTL